LIEEASSGKRKFEAKEQNNAKRSRTDNPEKENYAEKDKKRKVAEASKLPVGFCVNHLASQLKIGDSQTCKKGENCRFDHADLAKVQAMNKETVQTQIKAALGRRNPKLQQDLLQHFD
jgi:hypothetical protein